MDKAPIGVFDSGLGGLTVVRELLRLLPGESIIYFGDTARTPYGSRPPMEILCFMKEILNFFSKQKVKMAVTACNTMTALGLEQARTENPYIVIGVNNGAEAALKASKTKRIGILATEATINSGKHMAAIKFLSPDALVVPQACPQFVPLIEQEKFSGREIEAAAFDYLTPQKAANVDALILGCTHYPFITPLIRDIVGGEVAIIDPALETAVEAKAQLAEQNKLSDSSRGQVRLCFSADLERAERVARYAIDFKGMGIQPQFELVNLKEYL